MRLKFYIIFFITILPLFIKAQCTDLFISEYIEGSGNNKFLEIYNPTTSPVNLSGYNLQIFINGSVIASATLNLSGSIAAGDVYVIENSSETLGVLADLSTNSNVLNFNGDDAIALRNGTIIIDVIGQIGFDPGAQWGAGLQSTQDNTIRRKATIQIGDANGSNAFDPAVEWNGFTQDDISGLGSHTMNPCGIIIPPSSSGGMILNEISNGGASVKEFYEFVVIGNAANPTADVNLSGWIIDDNNGEFEGLVSGVGIADGHLRIAAGCLTAVKPGSIILIYNDADVNSEIPLGMSDPTDANNDCIYILMVSDACLESCSSTPSTSGSSYGCPSYNSASTWAAIGLRNNGDAGQIRKPDASFFHGFSYGDVGAPFPNFPAEFGSTSAFNVLTGDGTGRNYYFNCGSFVDESNFSIGNSGVDESPGAPNNEANRYFINAVRAGTYDYNNLSAAANCGIAITDEPCLIILSVKLQAFNAKKEERSVLLDWQLASVDTEYFTFELQRSADAVDFYPIAVIEGHSSIDSYLHYDREPMVKNYYRLKMVDAKDKITYSQIRNVNFDVQSDILIYPNPLRGSRQLTVISDSNIEAIHIFNTLGQRVYSENNPMQQIDLPNEISTGFYTLIIKTEISEIVRKLVIE